MEPSRRALAERPPAPPFSRITLAVRFMLPDMSEHACRAASVTAIGAVLLTSHEIEPGTPLVAYVDELGRIEAEAGERTLAGIAVTFHLTGFRLERVKAKLRHLAGDPGQHATAVQRRHERFKPSYGKAEVTLPNGKAHPCEIIDISLSGAAVRITVKPAIGSHLALGKTRGRVVRHLADGVAIEFVKQLGESELRKQLG